jgi:hypothetical protein
MMPIIRLTIIITTSLITITNLMATKRLKDIKGTVDMKDVMGPPMSAGMILTASHKSECFLRCRLTTTVYRIVNAMCAQRWLRFLLLVERTFPQDTQKALRSWWRAKWVSGVSIALT